MTKCIGCRKRVTQAGSPYCRRCVNSGHLPLCRVCGEEISGGRRWIYCSDTCVKAYYCQLRVDRIAAKSCPRCGGKSEKTTVHCRKCLDYLRKATKAREDRAPERGQCSRCIKYNPDWGKIKTCPACREYQRKFRDTMKDRTGMSWNEYGNSLRNKRKQRRNTDG